MSEQFESRLYDIKIWYVLIKIRSVKMVVEGKSWLKFL